MRRNYRIFDRTLSSDLPLPELIQSPSSEADLRFTLAQGPGDGAAQRGESGAERSGWVHHHDWCLPDGKVSLSCAKRGADYRLIMPGLAEFELHIERGEIIGLPLGNSDENSVRHLLIDQVIPRWLGHAGRLVVHAGGVADGSGRAIGLLGPSGVGKSTLAGALEQRGLRLLNDDCLMLRGGPRGLSCLPAYPGLRIWKDSAAALHGDAEAGTPMAGYGAKRRLRPPGGAGGPARLIALFLLGGDVSTGLRLREASGTEAMFGILESLFSLDVADQQRTSSAFTRAGDLARALPIYRLEYPRDFARLPEICDLVIRRSGLRL